MESITWLTSGPYVDYRPVLRDWLAVMFGNDGVLTADRETTHSSLA
jgi:hypothetical protein